MLYFTLCFLNTDAYFSDVKPLWWKWFLLPRLLPGLAASKPAQDTQCSRIVVQSGTSAWNQILKAVFGFALSGNIKRGGATAFILMQLLTEVWSHYPLLCCLYNKPEAFHPRSRHFPVFAYKPQTQRFCSLWVSPSGKGGNISTAN